MSLQVSGALLTDVGRQRTVNEDWCGSFVPDDQEGAADTLSVWGVADGVSRFGTGRDAARLSVEAVLASGWDAPGVDVERSLVGSIETANRILIRRAEQAGPQPLPHAATIVVAVLRGHDAWIASAGDCRAYLIRDGAIRQLTQDHTI